MRGALAFVECGASYAVRWLSFKCLSVLDASAYGLWGTLSLQQVWRLLYDAEDDDKICCVVLSRKLLETACKREKGHYIGRSTSIVVTNYLAVENSNASSPMDLTHQNLNAKTPIERDWHLVDRDGLPPTSPS